MKNHCLSVLVLFALSTWPEVLVLAQERQPISHEALWWLKQVGSPIPSPDGRLAVVPVTQPAYDENDETSDLWLVSASSIAKSTNGSPSGYSLNPRDLCNPWATYVDEHVPEYPASTVLDRKIRVKVLSD